MIEEYIRLRAHHGMCLTFFEGKGYNKSFTAHMQSILNMMQDNPKLRIIAEGDLICSKCPNLTQEGICSTPDLVGKYDHQVLELCGLKENSEMNWNEFSRLITDKILAKGKREDICGDCEWSEICKKKEQLRLPGSSPYVTMYQR